MRYSSIDVLRTVAIFVMVLVHFGENLSGFTSPLAGFGAPLFAFLSGVSYQLWVKGQEAKQVSDEDISKITIRRGLFVIGAGFAFNILVWLPEDVFNWDVLTFVGTALLVLNLVRRVPLTVSVWGAGAALFVSPLLRRLADYDAYWTNRYFECDLTLQDLAIGFFVTGYFPFFPWIAYSLSGLVAASVLFAEADDSEAKDCVVSPWPTVICGACLAGVSLAALFARPYLPAEVATGFLGGWKMFPPTIEYVLGTLGLTLMLLGVVHYCMDRESIGRRYQSVLNIAKTFSRYSFTIYILHHLVHLWPLWAYAVAIGHEPTYFWMNAVPLSLSIPFAFAFLICCYGVLRLLGPDRNWGIEGWMRWLCD